MRKRMYNPRIFLINYQYMVRSEAKTYSERGGHNSYQPSWLYHQQQQWIHTKTMITSLVILLPQFQIIRRFVFSGFIAFAMHLDISYVQIHSNRNVQTSCNLERRGIGVIFTNNKSFHKSTISVCSFMPPITNKRHLAICMFLSLFLVMIYLERMTKVYSQDIFHYKASHSILK